MMQIISIIQVSSCNSGCLKAQENKQVLLRIFPLMIVTIAKSFKQVISVKEGNIGLYFFVAKILSKTKVFCFHENNFC